MKEKNSQDYWFWPRWMLAALVHSVLQTGVWINELMPHSSPIFLFGSAMFLALLQYSAMTEIMRPSAKRWFLGTAAALILGILLRNMLISMRMGYGLNFIGFYFPVAIIQSWALSERFNHVWIYVLSFIPAHIIDLIIRSQIVFVSDISVNYYIDAAARLSQAIIWGIALFILQKYHVKEDSLLEENQYEIQSLSPHAQLSYN